MDYSKGFGGKYGVEKDKKDKTAEGVFVHCILSLFLLNRAGWDYHADLSKHESQKDYATGFGGKFGVQKDRQDKSAAGWNEKTELAKHESQKGWLTGESSLMNK